jgi:hypothetical protein
MCSKWPPPGPSAHTAASPCCTTARQQYIQGGELSSILNSPPPSGKRVVPVDGSGATDRPDTLRGPRPSAQAAVQPTAAVAHGRPLAGEAPAVPRTAPRRGPQVAGGLPFRSRPRRTPESSSTDGFTRVVGAGNQVNQRNPRSS